MSKCVLQPWVLDLSYMQQSVLITSVRGPDGIRKDHVAKLLLRWLRRCFLVSAFDGRALTDPVEQGGGSFTGPSLDVTELIRSCDGHAESECDLDFCPPRWYDPMQCIVGSYLSTVDELPHHFQLHFMHASEILGYKHTDRWVRLWWLQTYRRIVNDAHLQPESEERMDRRLGDCKQDWRAAEEIVAIKPSERKVVERELEKASKACKERGDGK